MWAVELQGKSRKALPTNEAGARTLMSQPESACPRPRVDHAPVIDFLVLFAEVSTKASYVRQSGSPQRM
jgi:hypothetical protein